MKKKKKERKETTKDGSGSEERQGKGRSRATSVALAPTVDSEIDDAWADDAVRAPPPGLANQAELRATAATKETAVDDPKPIVEAPVLG